MPSILGVGIVQVCRVIRDLVAEVNTELRQAKLPDCAILLDASSLLDRSEDRLLPEQYRIDTLHINNAAYERLTASLRSALDATHRPARLERIERPAP